MSTRVVAVVDRVGPDTSVWWVALRPSLPQRLCGAWILDDDRAGDQQAIVTGRAVLATPSGRAALTAQSVEIPDVFDAIAFEQAIRAELAALRSAFEQANRERAARSKFAPLVLPALPRSIDAENPPAHPDVPDAPRALLITRQLEAWCDTWTVAEERRLARPLLRDLFGAEVRDLPSATGPAKRIAA